MYMYRWKCKKFFEREKKEGFNEEKGGFEW
jgi:hypothetical protein